jgi:hypothetical protein
VTVLSAGGAIEEGGYVAAILRPCNGERGPTANGHVQFSARLNEKLHRFQVASKRCSCERSVATFGCLVHICTGVDEELRNVNVVLLAGI